MSILKRTFVGSLLVAFLLVATVCVVTYAAAPIGSSDMNMIGCPFAGHGGAVCDMSPLEHIAMWQNLFAAVPMQSTVAIFMFLLALFLLAYSVQQFRPPVPTPQPVRAFYPQETFIYDPLRRFIARGLMHPKLF